MAREILIADSDKADKEEFQRIFESTDYHLIFSESGEDALLRAKFFKPDMIIASGTGLLKMGGLELCKAIKGDPEFKQTPFILISGIFDEISEKDRKRIQADGVIAKPLNEDDILNLVDHLMEAGAVEKREDMVSEKQGKFLLDEGGEGEEEIIELVDVVEEPEPRMNIDNFIASGKEEPFGEITALDSWDKLEFEEKPKERDLVLRHEPEIGERDFPLRKEMPPKEVSPEEELFEKIELEEILEKVEQLKPSIEKEWPSEREIKDKEYKEEKAFKIEEPEEKYLDLEEFEMALQKEVKAELPEEELQPFLIEEPEKEISEEAIPVEESVEEEELKELSEEEFPDELLAEILGEEEISFIEEPKEVRLEEVRAKERMIEEIRRDSLEEVEVPKIVQEVVPPLMKTLDKQMQEAIAEKVQVMTEEIIRKLVPEMTQNVIGLTLESIEKMVREIVPDLAEKAIQAEIKRLQKGEKD